ncbi:Gfo/Idh/MocA family protein [Pseudomonas sp. H9]|uniref:Gfo/Idh/MocA family protein n=1 Tax=Pseudomonas sp. H9 TaxID=483968 RepID=UPI001057CA35|nr:Gfo/Idh/MocA family oxidoreductase [Pseudomonas sp. H9]TDF81192.1 Gfo/Idh/MocA family oxidoreductase [Pseudomonas sp. H9]
MNASNCCLVIGSGSIAKRHIRNLRLVLPGTSVHCVSASGRQLKLEEVHADVVHSSLESAIATGPICAIVASPAPWHLSHANQLMAAGIPVLIEKPLVVTTQDAIEIAAQAVRHNAYVDIGYNLRFLPSARCVKDLIQQESLGRIYSVHADVGQYLPDWRPMTDFRHNVSAQRSLGGGVLLELSHELDYLNWLFGPVVSVYCKVKNTGALDIDVEDCVDAMLTFSDDIVATLHMDFLQRAPMRTCKIIGDKGTIVWNLNHNHVDFYGPAGLVRRVYEGSDYDRNDMYVAELRNFVNMFKHDAAASVTLQEATHTLCLIEAMRQSSDQGLPVNIKKV